MRDAYLSRESLIIDEGVFTDEDGEEYTHLHDIPLPAIGSRAELLGLTDVVDVVEACHRIALYGEPEEDPVTGENAWSETLAVLTHREQQREDAALRARAEGTRDDPRSPHLRAAMEARKCVRSDGGGDVLSACRSRLRRQMGVPDPAREPSSVRSWPMTCSPEGDCSRGDEGRVFTQEDRDKIASLLGGEAKTYIEACREEFCHSLTSNVQDPLRRVDFEPTRREVLRADQVMDRYREAA